MQTEWRSFQGGAWETEVNVRDFIQKNYHPYDGDDSFLEGPTQDTTDLWDQVLELSRQEREAGGQAFQTCSPAVRRYPYGDQGVRGQWIQSRS